MILPSTNTIKMPWIQKTNILPDEILVFLEAIVGNVAFLPTAKL